MLTWNSVKDSIISFGKDSIKSFWSYVIPIGMLLLVNTSVTLHAYDIEKQGILWLHYSQLGEAEREASFPASEKDKTKGLGDKEREIIASAM